MRALFMYVFIWAAGYFYASDASTAKTEQHTSSHKQAVTNQDPAKFLFIDVHHMGPGKVSFEDVASAHAKDLTVEKKFGVRFLKCWLDEADGTIYCLSSATDSQGIRKTHAAAHGLLPDQIFRVSEGSYALLNRGKDFYLEMHEPGAGSPDSLALTHTHKNAHGLLPAYIVKVKPVQ